MKSQQQSQKITKHTSSIEEYIKEDSDFHLADESEYDALHNILEEEGMELKNFVDIKYSRRPDIVGSYLESRQIPALVTNKKNSFLGVMSEMTVFSFGESKKIYYTSDLRVSKGAGMRTRMNFRKMYVNVLRQIGSECFTVVLKENVKAINALTKNKHDLHYNSVYEYCSRSVLVLPTIRFSKSIKGFEIEKGRSIEFENSKIKSSAFAHEVGEEDDFFLLKNEGEVVGSFSLARPENRSIRVEAKNAFMQFWVQFASKLFSHDYKKKLPWIYMTSLYLNEDLNPSECVNFIIKTLHARKLLSSGEILLFCHDASENVELDLFSPEFSTNGLLYRVSADEPVDSTLNGPVYLNPLCL